MSAFVVVFKGDKLADRVVGPFVNAAIADAYARAEGARFGYEVVELEPTPKPVVGANYYGGPVERVVRDSSNPQWDPYD